MSAMNLVPFRTKDSYSDGAQIYQVLSNGPWADLHRAFSVAGSSQVTSLRPRNYDIEAILRAERGITQGRQGLLQRLLAYSHFLDQDRIPDAAEALGEAGLIYNQSASDITAELLTAFVFGSAYILARCHRRAPVVDAYGSQKADLQRGLLDGCERASLDRRQLEGSERILGEC